MGRKSLSKLGEFLLDGVKLPEPLPVVGLSHDITLQLGDYKYGFMIQPGTGVEQPINEIAPVTAGTQTPIYAQGSWRAWTQDDWRAGLGQDDWREEDKFCGSSMIHAMAPNRLSLASRWPAGIEITSSNDDVDFDDGGSAFAASVTAGTYTPSALATALKNVMDAQGGQTYTVTYSATTGKFTIASDGATFNLLWDSGANASTTIGDALGFDTTADDTGSTSYTGDNPAPCSLDAGVTAVKFVDYGDDCFELCTSSIRVFDVSAEAWLESEGTIPAACTDGIEFGANLVVLFGDGNKAKYWNGSAWSDVAGTNYVNGDLCISWKNEFYYTKANAVHKCTAPETDGTAAAEFTVGDASTDISSLSVFGSYLMIGKPNGLYYYDGTTLIQILDRTSEQYVNNFKNMCEYQGFLYFGVMQRVYKFSLSSGSATLVEVTPRMPKDSGESAQLYGFGLPIAFTVAGSQLYVFFDDGHTSGLYPMLLAYNGRGWHQIYMHEAMGTAYACNFSPNSDRLWVNMGDTRGQRMLSVSEMPYPDYEEESDFRPSVHHGGFPNEQKSWKSIWMRTRNCTEDQCVEVYIETNEGTNENVFTLVGTIITSPFQELYFDTAENPISRKQLRLRLKLKRGSDSSLTPIIERMGVMFQDRLRAVHGYRVWVRIGPAVDPNRPEATGMELLPGYGVETIPPEELVAFLQACERNVTGLTYTDQDGYEHAVLMNALNKQNPIIRPDGQLENLYQLLLMEIA